MKIVHCMPNTAHGKLSFDDLRAGSRGVTGSEQAMLYLARAQAKAGHRVTFYIPTKDVGMSEGVEIIDYTSAYPRLRRTDTADVVIAWLSADILRGVPERAVRIHSLQINDWLLCAYGYEPFVDVFVAVSESHKQWLMEAPGNPGPRAVWQTIPNGVDLQRFQTPGARRPYRCVYASSPDRGLHWVMAMWPEIRFAYPEAELHVYYEVKLWLENALRLNSDVGMRATFIESRLKTWGGEGRHGFYLHGAVSPDVLAGELLRSDVLLYPCDTVRPTEGFGVSVLEACAAGAVPVITDVDAFGEIYGNSGAVVVPRDMSRAWTDQYLDAVLSLLKDRSDLETRRKTVQDFAQRYDWRLVSQRWQEMIDSEIQRKARC